MARRRLETLFWSLHSRTWDDRLDDVPTAERIDELVAWLLAGTAGEHTTTRSPTVLDLGCGTGNHSRALVQHGAHAIGIDFAPGMLAKAAAKLGPDHSRGPAHPPALILADVHDGIPLADEAVDAALSVYSAQFFDLHELATEVRRALRPGGVLVLELPRPDAAPRPSNRHLSRRHRWFQLANRTAAAAGRKVGKVNVPAATEIHAALGRAGYTNIEHRDTPRSYAIRARHDGEY